MPHSISPEGATIQSQENMFDTEETGDDAQIIQEAEDISANKDAAELNDDDDITMADAGVQGEAIPTPATKPEVKLEDLFADVESDDEFPSTNAKDKKASSSPEAPASPVLRKDVLRLMPSRFEIGPVYSTNPRDRKTLRKSSAFRPIAKELCFDIDLTDYDEIRTCCDKANICNKCWQFITMAIKVVDVALRDDFGFKHIMWVYSGRRGAHAWVCDKKARQMDDQKRRAIAGYLELIRGGAQTAKKVNVKRPLHPHVFRRSLDILKGHFQNDILQDQDPWEEDDKVDKLLQLLPDRTLNESLRKKWSSSPGRSSASKWADIDALAKTTKGLDPRALLEAKQDIVLEYTYPRLDIEVSKHLNHLLKSPFVVHPGTGRVCVPIDTRHVGDFDPLAVPTVTQLLGEIDQWTAPQNGEIEGKSIQDWEKTSLKPFVDYFRSFVAALIKDESDVKVKRERGTDGMGF
ncbi:hypothetical protein SS1G_11308 [Sclerotinia sclerotiorum 1980 UF-70]|uniref:DNA primase n=1 Tax=Sclerotinia sclerotiorum (strain ATCC 18683 / 1980 / Ss-1) TaxID=665079 RepID=A7F138_SCLS1|nr:hypothetical protein SS1G_11308 [Sclerotinia sclerotiorum 1980 UF-70]EDN95430.1 hypothetical protein SS1G_11308 [Sclerotinia sclerotiorum 1980 UF-70]